MRATILSIIIIIFLSGIASAETYYAEGTTGQNIQDTINQAESGDTVIVKAGTYTISEQLVVNEGITLKGEVGDDGELLTTLFLEDNSNFDEQEPLLIMKSNSKVLYMGFNGNSETQKNVPVKRNQRWGNGYHNFIGAYYDDNLEVAYCNFYNNLGDGFRPRSCTNVEFHDNSASKGGHDVLFAIRCENVEAYNNYVELRVNSAFRFMDVSNGAIYNNTIKFERYIDGERSAAGPAIQIQNDKGEMQNIEVCGNYIYDSWGPAYWIVGKTSDHAQEVWIHHNVMYNAGGNINIYWVGGVIASGYDNILIENNVFDGSFLGAVNFWAYSSAWATKATATLKNNVFVDSIEGVQSGVGGWGVNNEISKQSVVSEDNCYFNNEAGNTRGCSVSGTDYFTDPRSESTSCDIKWSGSEWIIPGVVPKELNTSSGVYDDEDEITDTEIDEFEWSNYFLNGVLNFKYPANAVTRQTPESLNYYVKDKNLDGVGKVAGTIKILGWNNLTVIDNESYVSDYNTDAIIYSRVIKNPALNLWSGGISKTKKTINITVDNETVTAKLTVKVSWYNLKKDPTTGTRKKSKIHESTYTFTDSYSPAPKILPQPKKVTGTIYQYYDSKGNPIKWDMKVHEEGLQSITYRVDNNESTHIFMVGVSNTTENGVKFTEYSRLEYWTGDKINIGDWVEGAGQYDDDNVKVIAHGIYKDYDNVDFEIVKKEIPKKLIAWWVYPEVVLDLALVFGIWFIYNRIKQM